MLKRRQEPPSHLSTSQQRARRLVQPAPNAEKSKVRILSRHSALEMCINARNASVAIRAISFENLQKFTDQNKIYVRKQNFKRKENTKKIRSRFFYCIYWAALYEEVFKKKKQPQIRSFFKLIYYIIIVRLKAVLFNMQNLDKRIRFSF